MTEISYKGAHCIVLQTKQAIVVVDPASVEQKSVKITERAKVQFATQPQFIKELGSDQLIFSAPGEYEVADLSAVGVDAESQLDPEKKTVMYRLMTPDCAVAIIGHANPDKISDEQLEQLGVIDILIVPVGGNGYTIDPHGASQLARRISPKVVIPVHYEDGTAYKIPQQSVESFVKEMGIPVQKEQSLKIKQPGQLPGTLTLIVLDRS